MLTPISLGLNHLLIAESVELNGQFDEFLTNKNSLENMTEEKVSGSSCG